jgi:aspartate racemase
MYPANPILGVIGGMGPEATVDFLKRLTERTYAEDDRDHLHVIVESNPKIASRIAHLIEGHGEDPTPELVRIARNLEAAGASLLAMPCNTAHNYAEAICAAVTIPLINMIESTVEHLERLQLRRVGLLASTAVHQTGVYARALKRRGIDVVTPANQEAVMALIRGVKAGRTDTGAKDRFAQLAESLHKSSDGVVIACTELSVLGLPNSPRQPVIDALDVLTTTILERTGVRMR